MKHLGRQQGRGYLERGKLGVVSNSLLLVAPCCAWESKASFLNEVNQVWSLTWLWVWGFFVVVVFFSLNLRTQNL